MCENCSRLNTLVELQKEQISELYRKLEWYEGLLFSEPKGAEISE